MQKTELPKLGDKIETEKFHVSPLNVRHNEAFGETEKDKTLIQQVRQTKKIEQPFKARPEQEGYGVFMGRRRFLAIKTVGIKQIVVGEHVLIVDNTEEDARRASLIENLKVLRQDLNPITRAQELNELISSSPDSLRGTAIRLGISAATLSEWLKVLDLSPAMQKAVAEGKIYYTDALHLSRMKLGELGEEKLAKTLETEGYEAFQKELERTATGTLKRGIPKDKYYVERITFDKYYPPDMDLHKKLKALAEKKNMPMVEYIKKEVLEPHVKAAG